MLDRLQKEGRVAERDGRWEPLETDGVFIDPVLPLLDGALQGGTAPWVAPTSRDIERGISISNGERSLLVFIERLDPRRRYFTALGKLGIYYRDAGARGAADETGWTETVMRRFVQAARELVEHAPNITAKEATAHLRTRFADRATRG